MGAYGDLLQMAFSNKKPEPSKPAADPAGITDKPQGFVPEVKQKEDSRDKFNPDVMANVQAYVWNNGVPPPPKAPNKLNNERGTAAALKPEDGWGKV